MKKRISALVLSSCLLAGCAGQGAAATGETAAPSQAVPTAAPQSLTVNGLLDTSAAVGALELYAQAQNVTLQNSFETETADLVILDAPPQDDGTWKNLAENELLAAAAQRAGLDTESTVTALPVGQSLYAYWADNRVLTELLQSDAALDDLRAATWEEWFDFVTAVTHWCAEPGAVQVTLNGNVYTLPAERRETLANLNGVFAAQGPEVSGNSGDGGVAENTPALYTTALLAAGEPLTEENLTGPLNALEQELRLEDANSAWQAGIADLWTSKYLFQQGNALFYRGYLADPSRVNFSERRGPSTGAACQLCAGVTAVEVLKILLGRGKVLCAPWGFQFDAYRNRYVKTWRPGGNRNPLQQIGLFIARRQLRAMRR